MYYRIQVYNKICRKFDQTRINFKFGVFASNFNKPVNKYIEYSLNKFQ